MNSYTCGAPWRTCNCTEADQARRDAALAAAAEQRDGDARREEEEVRAAIAAVEAAERTLQREREVEDARLLAEAQALSKQEDERIERLHSHFEQLRKVLDNVKFQQRQAIARRHEAEDMETRRLESQTDIIVAERERAILVQQERIRLDGEEVVKTLQRRHASAMMETIARHRRDQDALIAGPVDPHPGEVIRISTISTVEREEEEVRKAAILETLLPAQEVERSTLKSMQARELEKFRKRTDTAYRRFDVRMLVLKARLEEAEKVRQRNEGLRRTAFADWKWFGAVFDDRSTMLAEDEERVVRNGSEAPSTGHAKTKIHHHHQQKQKKNPHSLNEEDEEPIPEPGVMREDSWEQREAARIAAFRRLKSKTLRRGSSAAAPPPPPSPIGPPDPMIARSPKEAEDEDGENGQQHEAMRTVWDHTDEVRTTWHDEDESGVFTATATAISLPVR